MKIAYTEAGRGVPLVLLHAFPLNAVMWAAQLAGLSDECRLIAPHQRGFGGSPLPADDPPDLDLAADDLARLLDELDLPRVVLCGASMGGYVALSFLRRYPQRVGGLLLADTKATVDSAEAAADRHRLAGAVEAAHSSALLATELLPKLLGETTRWQRPEVYETVAELVRAQPPAAVAWAERAMAARPDATDLLAGIAVPTLVLVGEQDVVTPPSDSAALAEAIPHAQLRHIPAAGHLTALEAPERFNAVARTLLARCLAERSVD